MYLACKLGSNTKVLVKSFADWTGIDKLSNSTSFIDILLDESSLIIWLPWATLIIEESIFVKNFLAFLMVGATSFQVVIPPFYPGWSVSMKARIIAHSYTAANIGVFEHSLRGKRFCSAFRRFEAFLAG